MFHVRKPDDAAVKDFIERQRGLTFSYPEVGFTRANFQSPPAGYAFDRARAPLGFGRATFDAAVAAFRRWEQFNVGWAEAVPGDTPLSPGEVVAVRVQTAGLWSLHACRIIYVMDDAGPPMTCFGFGYGTLPGHAETGEERFLITWDHASDEVIYEVAAFFRPRHLLVRLGWPVGKHLVNRFRRDSAAAMRKSVNLSAERVSVSRSPS
jgi:uncharacterized protein (UPF0548 family)